MKSISIQRKAVFLCFGLAICPMILHAQGHSLREKIGNIVNMVNGDVGVAIRNLSNGDTATWNKSKHMPMQSVYKLPLGIYILSQVDKGILKMDQKILVRPSDYSLTWSPIMKKYPDANVEITLEEVLMYTITWSDNVGCDLLFRLAGGALVVNDYFHALGIEDIAIRYTEKEMHEDWEVQYKNWCTPAAMLQLLERVHKRDLLSKSSNDFLWRNMVDCTLGKSRIRGLLPSGTEVGHRTGTSSRNEKNMIGALNDVGIMKLPDGTQIAIVVYTSNSVEDEARLEAVIANIAKATYDHYKK